MTNREKFRDELDNMSSIFIAVVNGKPVLCEDTDCRECDFYGKCTEKKDVARNWLNAEYQEPPVDWNKVPIDTKVLFTDCEGNEHKGYFAGVEETCLTVWKYGTASWTADGERMVSTHVKLAEGNE